MQKNVIETITGAVVLGTAAFFFSYAYKHSQLQFSNGYHVQARFSDVTGLSTGSDVRIGGVKVGVISGLALDSQTYEAVATLEVKQDVELPADSSAAVVSSGLLGDKFVAITPGGDDAMLGPGGRLEYTQSSVNLEEMIGKFMFSGGGVDKEESSASPSQEPSDAPE